MTLRGLVLVLGLVGAVWAGETSPVLTAEQVIERNVAARGGIDAWRKLKTMAWIGHVEARNLPRGSMPFVLEMERPDKTRFSVDPQGQPSARIFDGNGGWRVRMTRDGSPEVKPYSEDEVRAARDSQGIDSPLVDAFVRRLAATLTGMDSVDGKPAYLLEVSLPSGTKQHVWVDAESFLDVRIDRETKDRGGKRNTVWISFRDFRTVDGLKIPGLIETSAVGGDTSDRMVVERIFVNPELSAQAFAEPTVPVKRRKVIVDTRGAGAGTGMTGRGAPSTAQAQGGR